MHIYIFPFKVRGVTGLVAYLKEPVSLPRAELPYICVGILYDTASRNLLLSLFRKENCDSYPSKGEDHYVIHGLAESASCGMYTKTENQTRQ